MLFYLLVLAFSLELFSDEFPTLINPDGSFQFREFNSEQKKTYVFLKNQINYFHSEISKIVPYLNRMKLIQKDEYTREFRNYIEVEPYTRKQFFLVDTFTIKTAAGKFSGIDFKRNRTLIEANRDPETVIKSIGNEIVGDDFSTLNLKVVTYANYSDPKNPLTQKFVFKEMISPLDRIKLMRAYRNKVEEALRSLDKMVDRKALNDNTSISNTLKEIEIE